MLQCSERYRVIVNDRILIPMAAVIVVPDHHSSDLRVARLHALIITASAGVLAQRFEQQPDNLRLVLRETTSDRLPVPSNAD